MPNNILEKYNITTKVVSSADLCETFVDLIPANIIQSYGEIRKNSFALGRLSAWKLLEELKSPPHILINDKDGVPYFPEELKGSLSHKGDKAACAGTLNKNVISVGIDLEKIKSTNPELLLKIGTEFEQRTINQFDTTTILSLFSLKEAIYKAVFPLIRRPLYFKDAEIEFTPSPVIKALNAPEIPLSTVNLASLTIDGYIFSYCIVTKP